MRYLALGLALLASPAFAQEHWGRYNEGIRWEDSLDEAFDRARMERKPILFFQLVGDLDKEGC